MEPIFQQGKVSKGSKKELIKFQPIKNQQKKKNNIFQKRQKTNQILSNVLMTTSIIKRGNQEIKMQEQAVQVEQQLLGSGNQQQKNNLVTLKDHRSEKIKQYNHIKDKNKYNESNQDNIFKRYLSPYNLCEINPTRRNNKIIKGNVIQFNQESQGYPQRLNNQQMSSQQQSGQTLQKNNKLNKSIGGVNKNLIKSKQKLFGQNLIEDQQQQEKQQQQKQKVQKNPFIKSSKQSPKYSKIYNKYKCYNPFDSSNEQKNSGENIKKESILDKEFHNNFFINHKKHINGQKFPQQTNKQNNIFNANKNQQKNSKASQKHNIFTYKFENNQNQPFSNKMQKNKLNKFNIFQKQQKINEQDDLVQKIQQPQELPYFNKANLQLQKNLRQKQSVPQKSKEQYNNICISRKTKKEKLVVIKQQKIVDKNVKDFLKFQNLNDNKFTQKLFLPQKYISKISSMGQQMNRLITNGCIKDTVKYLNQYCQQLQYELKTAHEKRKDAIINAQQLKKNVLDYQARMTQIVQENQNLRQELQRMQQIKQQNRNLRSQIYHLKSQKNKQTKRKLHFQTNQNANFSQADTYFQTQMASIHKFFTLQSGYDVKQQTKKFNIGILKILQNWPISQIKRTVHMISQVLIIAKDVGRKYHRLKMLHKKCPENLSFEDFQKLIDNQSSNQLQNNVQTTSLLQIEQQISEPAVIYKIIQKISQQQKDKKLFLFLEYKYVLLCSYLAQSFNYSTFSTSQWIDRSKEFQEDLNNYFAEKQVTLSQKTLKAENNLFQTFIGWQKRKQKQIFKLIFKQQ